jgi:hypothetical protein
MHQECACSRQRGGRKQRSGGRPREAVLVGDGEGRDRPDLLAPLHPALDQLADRPRAAFTTLSTACDLHLWELAGGHEPPTCCLQDSRALEVATGQVTDACHPRHRHGGFLDFLKLVARAHPR